MKLQLSQNELNRLLPADPPVNAHCRRVAALAREIAPAMRLAPRYCVILNQAALLHHTPALSLDPQSLRKVMIEVLPGGEAPRNVSPGCNLRVPEDLEAALRAFRGGVREEPNHRIRKAVEILTFSDLLDEQLEFLWLQPDGSVWERLASLRETFEFDVVETAEQVLSSKFRGPGQRGWELPVQALVAQDTVATLTVNRDCDLRVLRALAERDPVLCGMLVQAANSARYARRVPAKSAQQAISFLGADISRCLLLTLALKTIFVSSRFVNLWRHAVASASFCERLAEQTGFLPAEEALLLGLVHDIGTVAMCQQPRGGALRQARLSEQGLPQLYTEQLQFGVDHATIGAEVLESWRFPEYMVEAVRFHHRPADTSSGAAALLYLAEFWSESDGGYLAEDLPSLCHWNAALHRTGWTMETLAKAGRKTGSLTELLGVG
jgi:HD-like signal output (HDOD) protein